MGTKLTRPTNGVSYGYKHTITAQEVIDRGVTIDFQVDYELAANVGMVTDVDVVAAFTNLNIGYPALGQVRLADNALVTAMLLCNELKTLLNAHYLDEVAHTTAPDDVNTITAPDAIDFATMLVLGSELLVNYDVHDDDSELGSNWLYHDAIETGDHSPTDVTALTTIGEALTQLNDLKAKYDAHDADSQTHGGTASDWQTTVGDVLTSGTLTEDYKLSVIANKNSA